jgi:Zn-finger nucleic acid-binding protein
LEDDRRREDEWFRETHCEGVFFDAGELDQVFAKRAEERRGFFRRLAGI